MDFALAASALVFGGAVLMLEALLAHELGHHRGMHPIVTAMVWWLSLPGEALAWAYRADRAAADRGYAHQLSTLYAFIGEAPPGGLMARLTADHPPMRWRLERLAGREAT